MTVGAITSAEGKSSKFVVVHQWWASLDIYQI